MKLLVNDKEYTIKYGIEATAKSGILSKMVNAESQEMTIENIEKIALIIGEVLLVGLQNKHSDEFGYNLDSDENKTEMMSKACEIIDDYTDIEGNDIFTLYGQLQEEMMKNGFIKSLFEKAMEQAKMDEPKKKTTKKTTKTQ